MEPYRLRIEGVAVAESLEAAQALADQIAESVPEGVLIDVHEVEGMERGDLDPDSPLIDQLDELP